MTEQLPTLTYEVHVKRGPRQWTVVEVFPERDAALAFARTQQPSHHAVRVTIERYDERTNTYQSTIVYEWLAPKYVRPSATVVARTEHVSAGPPRRLPPRPKPSIWDSIATAWRRLTQ